MGKGQTMTNEFRVWCKENNEWEKHVCFLNNKGYLFHFNGDRLIPLKKENHIISWDTGRYDKNGNSIYEGDIIKCDYILNCYNKPLIQFYEFSEGLFDIFSPEEFGEVVGNIYKNKIEDFIKGEK